MKVDVPTLIALFRRVMEHDLPDAMNYRTPQGWQPLSAKEVYRRTINMARHLRNLGVGKGDRVALLSENRYEWAIADFSTLMLGAMDVPIYPTLTAEQTAYILKDSGAKVAFVSTRDQMNKMLSIQELTDVKHIIVMDEVAVGNVHSMSAIMTALPYEVDAELDRQADTIQPDDIATIIYTSGTTGTSKGVVLTHRNLVANIAGSTEAFQWSHESGFVSFLPLSHITARHVDYVMMGHGVGISYCPSFDDLMQTIQEVRPHNFVSVPRVYEKVRQEVERRSNQGLKKKIFDWAMAVGKSHRADIQAGKVPASLTWKLAHKLVFSKIQRVFGGRVVCFISGGAPLGLDLCEWFADAGIRIFEGYGLTETSPVIAINNSRRYRAGSVGPPLGNVEHKLAEDGELMVRGPSVTKGYWKLPEETAASFENGWFKTGDIARIDDDGFVFITDRKKDLLKTSGGKFIAPQPIENALKNNVLVAHAAVVGDKRRYVAVLIAPHFALLEDWAHANGITFASREDLIHHEKVCALYEGIVADLNTRLAQFERLKRFILVPDEFSIASGELTPSLKLKRRVVEQKYSHLIEALYAETINSP